SRVLHAAATAAAPVELSVATRELAAAAEREGVAKRDIRVEDARTFAARIDTLEHSRIRLLGSADAQLREAIAARLGGALDDAPVASSGRLDLLPSLREPALSATDHRYGNPLPEQLDLTGGLGWERGAPRATPPDLGMPGMSPPGPKPLAWAEAVWPETAALHGPARGFPACGRLARLSCPAAGRRRSQSAPYG